LRGIDARQRELIEDAVNEGLTPYSVAALEKDLHLTFILERLHSSESLFSRLVLCGGTSLVKGHKLVARMSEDIDFRVAVDSGLSKSQRQVFLSGLRKRITSLLSSDGYVVEAVSAHDRNRFFHIELRYSPAFPLETALRSHILLEFTAESPFLTPVVCQSGSLLSLAVSEELRPFSLPCLDVRETVAEKTVAFLRRSRSITSQPDGSWDRRLIRHVYDVGSIVAQGVDYSTVEAAFVNAMNRDSIKYANQDPEFFADPRMVLTMAAENLNRDVLELDYGTFVESLVAGPALSFHEAFEQFGSLVQKLLQ